MIDYGEPDLIASILIYNDELEKCKSVPDIIEAAHICRLSVGESTVIELEGIDASTEESFNVHRLEARAEVEMSCLPKLALTVCDMFHKRIKIQREHAAVSVAHLYLRMPANVFNNDTDNVTVAALHLIKDAHLIKYARSEMVYSQVAKMPQVKINEQVLYDTIMCGDLGEIAKFNEIFYPTHEEAISKTLEAAKLYQWKDIQIQSDTVGNQLPQDTFEILLQRANIDSLIESYKDPYSAVDWILKTYGVNMFNIPEYAIVFLRKQSSITESSVKKCFINYSSEIEAGLNQSLESKLSERQRLYFVGNVAIQNKWLLENPKELFYIFRFYLRYSDAYTDSRPYEFTSSVLGKMAPYICDLPDNEYDELLKILIKLNGRAYCSSMSKTSRLYMHLALAK